MHPCLGSILNVFHNKIQCILYDINATTTAINTCKKLFDVGQIEVIFFSLR